MDEHTTCCTTSWQHVVELLSTHSLVAIPATDESRTSCRCCTTFCLHES